MTFITARRRDRFLQSMIDAVQQHMDLRAQAYGYDSIKSAVTYAEEPVVSTFQQEGQAFRAWRSLVWAACYQIRDDVEAGRRPIVSLPQLLAELPPLVMPTEPINA